MSRCIPLLAVLALLAGCPAPSPPAEGPDLAVPADAAVPPPPPVDLAVNVPPTDARPRPDAAVGDGGIPAAFQACVLHTIDLPHCKDCCDCAPIGCAELTPCRNFCKDHDFTQNTGYLVDMLIPSTLGQNGDYSACVKENNTAQACKTCCECQKGFACGDFRYCRTLCDNSYP